MKIYNKKWFLWGITFLVPLPLFAFGIIKADWYQWFLSVGLSAKFLYAGLSKQGSERQNNIEKNYQSVSRELFGKYAWIKINLPWLQIGGFFGAALLVRFLFDAVIPLWIVICFAIILTVSVFYSIGLDREIADYIDKELNSDNQTKS